MNMKRNRLEIFPALTFFFLALYFVIGQLLRVVAINPQDLTMIYNVISGLIAVFAFVSFVLLLKEVMKD